MPLRPSTPTICPGNAASRWHSATFSWTRAPFDDALDPSNSMERSLSRPSSPSQTIRPHSTVSAWLGTPTVPTAATPSPVRRACTAATTRPSISWSCSSLLAARSGKASSIHVYAPCLVPVQSSLFPRSWKDAAEDKLGFSRLPTLTEDLRDTCRCFGGGSGVPRAGIPASDKMSASRILFGLGVVTSAAPGKTACMIPSASANPLLTAASLAGAPFETRAGVTFFAACLAFSFSTFWFSR
mmetsp:Transcript_34962/g.56157  ORF Transcript_34962/g.56157 Transcript_34962/m.56157 type:complete len:241 (+) Transcript_34962:773-1495(+)